MPLYTKELFAEWKKVSFARTTISQVVSRNSCFIFSAQICGDANGNSDAIIYNGVSDKDPPLKSLRGTTKTMSPVRFNPPVYCPRGIYVKHGSNVEDLCIQFIEEPKT